MGSAVPLTQIDVLDARLNMHWAVLSEFELHRMLREIPSLFPKSDLATTARLHNIMGRLFLRLKQYPDAMERFRAALSTAKILENPKGIFIFSINLGVAQMEAGQPADALESMLCAADLDDAGAWENVSLLANLVGPLAALGRHQDAEVLFQQAETAADLSNPDHIFRLAEAAAVLQQYHRAVDLLGRLLQLTTGETGTPMELLNRHNQNLEWSKEMLDAIDYVAAFDEQLAQPMQESPSNPKLNELRREIMNEYAPLRQRANEALHAGHE